MSEQNTKCNSTICNGKLCKHIVGKSYTTTLLYLSHGWFHGAHGRIQLLTQEKFKDGQAVGSYKGAISKWQVRVTSHDGGSSYNCKLIRPASDHS